MAKVNLSQQKQLTHQGSSKFTTAKANSLWQKQIDHSKSSYWARTNSLHQKQIFHSKSKISKAKISKFTVAKTIACEQSPGCHAYICEK